MIDLILTSPPERPITLFTRNFRVHSGIPIGHYTEGERSPLALVYGDISFDMLSEVARLYTAVVAMPAAYADEIPEQPEHYETMTVKAPILAAIRSFDFPGFSCFVKTFEGNPLVHHGTIGKTPILLFTADLVRATIRILSGDLEQKTGLDRYGRHQPLSDAVTSAPGVSFHFNLIENAVRYLYRKTGMPLLHISRWPESAPLVLFLSHDVDMVRKWTRKRIVYEFLLSSRDLFRFRGDRFRSTVTSFKESLHGRDPYWNFDQILFMESGNGFRSTWFWAPFGEEFETRENDYDPVYHRKSSEITAMIRRLVDNDCEVAFHGTRGAFRDTKAFRRQIQFFESRLGFKFAGVRHHYLMFRHGQTFETASETGMLYDATLGFSDRPGYRNGIAAPFFPFPVTHQAGKIVEIPLHFMDTVFLHSGDGSESVIRRITETYLFAKAAGGMFSVLIHPGNMDSSEIPALSRFYHSFLNRCRLDRARSMTGVELAHWWLARENVIRSMESGPGMWRIKGVDIPPHMDFTIGAPNIKSMRFSVEGAPRAMVNLDHDHLVIRPGTIDPDKGVAFTRQY
ncbi:MAG: polysaccharide deacetylase family protein [Candidatus Latescibacterota bacterium]